MEGAGRGAGSLGVDGAELGDQKPVISPIPESVGGSIPCEDGVMSRPSRSAQAEGQKTSWALPSAIES